VKLITHLQLVPRSENAWSCTSTPPILLHGVVLSLKKHRDNFTFTVLYDYVEVKVSFILSTEKSRIGAFRLQLLSQSPYGNSCSISGAGSDPRTPLL